MPTERRSGVQSWKLKHSIVVYSGATGKNFSQIRLCPPDFQAIKAVQIFSEHPVYWWKWHEYLGNIFTL